MYHSKERILEYNKTNDKSVKKHWVITGDQLILKKIDFGRYYNHKMAFTYLM
jgi:hypothetical protein